MDEDRPHRVLLLGDAGSIHLFRWAEALAASGLDIHVATVHRTTRNYEHAKLHILPLSAPLGYLSPAPLRKLLAKLQPDILHAHYATGYGHLAARSRFHPHILSVWGSDVLLFPKKSAVHRRFLRRNLAAADLVMSTSAAMRAAVTDLDPSAVVVLTPFGVDTHRFQKKPLGDKGQSIRIGTVKALSAVYGIDVLLDAFAIAHEHAAVPLELEVYGNGPLRSVLQDQAKNLGIDPYVTFHPAIAHDQVPDVLNRLDIFAALSRSESFGVSVIEASACELPVVVSDTDGLREVVNDGKTGLVVPIDDPKAAAEALLELVADADKRRQFGTAGRQLVMDCYHWQDNVNQVIAEYERMIAGAQHDA